MMHRLCGDVVIVIVRINDGSIAWTSEGSWFSGGVFCKNPFYLMVVSTEALVISSSAPAKIWREYYLFKWSDTDWRNIAKTVYEADLFEVFQLSTCFFLSHLGITVVIPKFFFFFFFLHTLAWSSYCRLASYIPHNRALEVYHTSKIARFVHSSIAPLKNLRKQFVR